MEEDGIIMPIVSISMKYYRSALYDDEITVKTIMKKLPGFKIDFEYEIHNQDNVLLTIGKTTLVFIDGNSQKPMKAPEFLMEKLKPFFE
jgi:acyl-CoA thioester hydrolase